MTAKSIFLKLVAAAGLALSSAAFAQATAVDPNDLGEYEPAAAQVQLPVAPGPVPVPEYQPLEVPGVPPVQQPQADAAARASAAVGNTITKEGVLRAAEGVFGRGAEGLALLVEDILKKQGEPTAYITGSEAGGAIVLGVRYGRGVLHHKLTGDQEVFWTGPSVGFDVGADASKVFVLVYNLEEGADLFTRFPAAEGNAFVVGGLNASYLRKGNTVLIPIRTGVGMRMGVNAGYMRFSKKNRWLPF
ncbi:MAG TPA: DUF1134 domain-containing protein [Allosphingosinicella sp.]|nr:DUF1134 domain-containing protein [Allosphingosinicella sp.]